MSIYVKDGWVYMDTPESESIPNGEYMSLEEYGKSYGIDPGTLRVMIHRGQINSIKVLHHRYIAVGERPKKCRL